MFKCNCPYEIRSWCSEPRCAHYVKPVNKLTPHTCPHCDFGTGQRGMDSCSKCDGTGSVFRVGLRLFPNTKSGYADAMCEEIQRG